MFLLFSRGLSKAGREHIRHCDNQNDQADRKVHNPPALKSISDVYLLVLAASCLGFFQQHRDMRNRGVIEIQTLRRLCLETDAITGDAEQSRHLGTNGTRMWTNLRSSKHQASVHVRNAISCGMHPLERLA